MIRHPLNGLNLLSTASKIIIGTLLLAGIFLRPYWLTAHAMDYNGSLLVSDDTFTATNAFSSGPDIQAWLASKGSVLSVLASDQLGDGANGRTAGQIIFDATHGIFTGGVYGSYAGYSLAHPLVMTLNPQVILATLQKEESLITTKNITDLPPYALRSALGMLCPDTSGCSPDAYGFTKQVIMGAAQLMINFVGSTNCPTFRAGSTVVLDGQNVTFFNAATAALYCYTPHPYVAGTFEGNHNFWYYMNLWFSGVLNSPTTSMRVMIAPDSGSVYAVLPDLSRKWPVRAMTDLAAWNLNQQLEVSTATKLVTIPTGTGSIARLQKGSGQTVYYIEGGLKYHIANEAAFPVWNLSWSELRTIDDSLLDQLATGVPFGNLARSNIRSDVFLITANRKYYIPDALTMANWGFTWDSIDVIPQARIDSYNAGGNLSLFAKSDSSPEIYVIGGGGRMYVPSAKVLLGWGGSFTNLTIYGKEEQAILPAGPTLSLVVMGSSNVVYFIENGQKRHLTSFAKLAEKGSSQADLIKVSDSLLNVLPLGTDL
jgi:uncharacterized protein